MATILAHIKIKPGSEAKYEEVQAELYRMTHANEKNVRRYEFWRGADEGQYYGMLSFDDYMGFIVHQSSPHHENATGLGDVIESIKLEWIDPIQESSPLAPTNAGELAAGASELQTRYHGMYTPTVQAWWKKLRK